MEKKDDNKIVVYREKIRKSGGDKRMDTENENTDRVRVGEDGG